jgi:glycosyltransferase involved in cell wall biosynthesis
MTGLLHVVLPNDIDDPATPSGGNAYDRRVCETLAAQGFSVSEHPVSGSWPRPSAADRAGVAAVLGALPDHALVLLDGLVASTVPEVLVPQASRLRLVVLVHMPLGDDAEAEALAAASAIVTTSGWTRTRLLERYGLPAGRVHVATPGVRPARLASYSEAGGNLLCVAAVTPGKGHDVLVAALGMVADLDWTCTCVGSLTRDPGFVVALRDSAKPLGDRFRLVGPRTGAALDDAYAAADLLVLASRGETYGMVVTEASARGVPVLATAVGGVPEALGGAGVLVAPEDPGALAGALRQWLSDDALRRRLRRAARDRRTGLTGWDVTAGRIAAVLTGVPV